MNVNTSQHNTTQHKKPKQQAYKRQLNHRHLITHASFLDILIDIRLTQTTDCQGRILSSLPLLLLPDLSKYVILYKRWSVLQTLYKQKKKQSKQPHNPFFTVVRMLDQRKDRIKRRGRVSDIGSA